MTKLISPLLLSLVLTFYLLTLSKPTFAQTFFFQEEFNDERAINTLDSSKWIVYPNSPTGFPTIRETGGNLVTSQQDFRTQYPLIVSKNNALPDGDFSAEIKFWYTNVTFWGTGIALAEQAPTNGGGFSSLLTIGAWQDRTLSNMRIGFNGVDIYTTPVNTSQHILKIDRVGKKYLLFLDGTLIFTSPDISKQVKYIWMGNPSLQPPIPAWTRFNVDYIRVTSFAPEPFLDLPWDYQGRGLDFNEAVNSMSSYFDHEYPLLSSGLSELSIALDKIIDFRGPPRASNPYTSHDGYDYARAARARNGDPILAAASGVATYMNSCSACGNAILIDHQNGFQTRYYHLQKDGLITNSPGQQVSVNEGQQIGKVGATGNVFPSGEAGAHIHFMVVKDKDGNGNFDDNIPDGVTDPFGWQSQEQDPWESFNFFYNGQNRTGIRSFYLWKKKLNNLDAALTSNGGIFEIGKYKFNFPNGATNQNLNLEINSSPNTQISNSLVSIGSSIIASARDNLGNIINQFNALFTLTLDLSTFDLTKYKPDTVSFYSSQDGINWTKEPTILSGNIAQTQINHMTHFGVFAERADTTSPTTNAILDGQMGQLNWFRSDVIVNLSAKDNEGGLGVDYTLYKLKGGDWETYSTPLNFTNEGHYKIEFYSVDIDENIEDFKQVEFDIDKTPPEAKIFFDPEKLDIVISENDQTSRPKMGNSTYELSDLAGNTLKLNIKDDDKHDEEEQTSILTIYSLQYSNNSPIDQGQALFRVKFENKNGLKIEQQVFEIKEKVKVVINYNVKTNQSTIILFQAGKKSSEEVRSGLVRLQVTTNQGNLEYSY